MNDGKVKIRMLQPISGGFELDTGTGQGFRDLERGDIIDLPPERAARYCGGGRDSIAEYVDDPPAHY